MTMATPRYAPEFRLTINDTPIPVALRAAITSVSLQDGLQGSDRVELQIANDNLRWLDHPLLALDNKLSMSIGYAPGPLAQVFVGEIVAHDASFPSSGMPTLTVAAQDFLHRTTRGTKRRWFGINTKKGNYPLPDVAIVSMVSPESGLLPLVDPIGAALSAVIGGIELLAVKDNEKARQKLIRKQDGTSDFDFLSRIAKENGWEMFIDHSGPLGGYQLRFQSQLDRLQPDVTLRYGQSLIDFTPRLSTVGQIAAVKVNVWVPKIKTSFSITAGWDWDRMALKLDVKPALNLGRQDAEVAASGALELIEEPLSLASAPRAILSRLIPKLNQRLTGSGSTVGDPRLTAGKVLRLEGLGIQFGGLYRITGTRHTIDSSGYRTSFEVRKEIWFGSIPLPQQGAVRIAGHRLGAGSQE
jgi:phage protein D